MKIATTGTIDTYGYYWPTIASRNDTLVIRNHTSTLSSLAITLGSKARNDSKSALRERTLFLFDLDLALALLVRRLDWLTKRLVPFLA